MGIAASGGEGLVVVAVESRVEWVVVGLQWWSVWGRT
jgi:hypothetical protein